jgi:tRNA-Thr(GGU) m(6)t(6)A37 methyltransferase TsaA
MDNQQLERFLQAAKGYGPREHAMFLFAVAHGVRASEICNLRINDINFKAEQIQISRLKGSFHSTQTLLRVKGNSLFNEAAALKEWLAVRQPDADNFVFNSQKGTRLNRVTVCKLFGVIARAAGLCPLVAQGLDGFAVSANIIVVTWLHQARRDVLKVHPRSDQRRTLTGVFATRSPDRPNPLGIHPVTVREIAKNRLRIGPIEVIDGTPVVDIKPVDC